ncbi:MAG: hypothetical protein KF819_25500 [Labilithrix sp.]|nr:hypothetical protein [Labilithrix sp.]
MSKRRLFLLSCLVPVLAHAACSASNGDPIPTQVFDASALDVGSNPDDPDGGTLPDGAPRDTGADAPADAPKDAPANAVVVINEIYVDTILDGDAAEFVELRAEPGTAVDDLKLRLVKPNGATTDIAVGVAGNKVGASGVWVVGCNRIDKMNAPGARVDREIPLATWGLDTPGAVQLVRGTTVLDVVGWNQDPDGGAPAAATPPPTQTVETKPAVVPNNSSATQFSRRRTFGRKSGAADTNDNAADFCTMLATPGSATQACE